MDSPPAAEEDYNDILYCRESDEGSNEILCNSDEEESLEEKSGEEICDIELSSSGEESDNDASHKEARSILHGLSVFLNFFHLTFRVSERAMLCLLHFIQILIQYISSLIGGHQIINCLLGMFPKSLYGVRKLTKQNYDIKEYVVCPKCNSLYSASNSIIKLHNGDSQSKCCEYIEFPNHKHQSRQTKCGIRLMKEVRIGGKSKLVPKKVFFYHSISSYLQTFIERKGFLEKCELWRKRVVPRNEMADVYDGDVWKKFQHVDGEPFLAYYGNLCLALNIDWFNPFKEAPYSAGAIYLVVLNLPRTERYKIENVILVGVMPGPQEPKKNINFYLKPLVADLEKLYS